MKRIFALLLALCLMFLCGCAAEPEQTQPSTEATQAPSTEATQPSTEATQAPSSEATEPEPLFYNPLTGEAMDEIVYARPFAVSMNNSKPAMPHHGIGAADIVYETLIEGETRCMGLFYNLRPETAETIGTIRSARYYFVQFAQAYDAIFVHNGASSQSPIGAKEYFASTGWEHLDAISTPGANKYYYRDRTDKYKYEHTLFIRPQGILSLAADRKLETLRTEPLDCGMTFDDDTVIVGQSGQKITAWFNLSGKPSAKWHKSTTFTYNKEDKLYYAAQYGSDFIDGNTGETIAFRNVLVLRTAIRTTESSLMEIAATGSGTGYFACNGQVVEINWSREKATDPFTYTLANGQPVTFGVGKTYVAVVPNKATVEIE